MKHDYRIMQLKGDKMRELVFLPYDEEKFDIGNYRVVYEGEVESENCEIAILDYLYDKFNVEHPEEYRGHSLSVSDVVVLDGVAYYCEDFGWRRIG